MAFAGVRHLFDVYNFSSSLSNITLDPRYRSSELSVPSRNAFDPSRHVMRDSSFVYGRTSSGVDYVILHIPWSKTEGSRGAKITLTDINDPTSPVPAFRHHHLANVNVPPSAPLFAYETNDGGWQPLTKVNWLARCNKIWTANGFDPLVTHTFRIGGCTELLLRGTNPDIVCVQGRWKSRAFLQYWRKIQDILPLFISNSFSDDRLALVHASMKSFKSRFLP
jgi:hypothetical protein